MVRRAGVWLNGVEIGAEGLTAALRRRRALATERAPDLVQLEVDASMPYEEVTRLVHACGAAGYRSVGFVGVQRGG